jgi:hypothetical protein
MRASIFCPLNDACERCRAHVRLARRQRHIARAMRPAQSKVHHAPAIARASVATEATYHACELCNAHTGLMVAAGLLLLLLAVRVIAGHWME